MILDGDNDVTVPSASSWTSADDEVTEQTPAHKIDWVKMRGTLWKEIIACCLIIHPTVCSRRLYNRTSDPCGHLIRRSVLKHQKPSHAIEQGVHAYPDIYTHAP